MGRHTPPEDHSAFVGVPHETYSLRVTYCIETLLYRPLPFDSWYYDPLVHF